MLFVHRYIHCFDMRLLSQSSLTLLKVLALLGSAAMFEGLVSVRQISQYFFFREILSFCSWFELSYL
jgi:hypothetical protein